jgi:hypothetical protein
MEISHIKNIAVGTEDMPVKHTFNEDETDKIKDEFISRQVKIQHLKEQLEEMKDSFKLQIKPLELEQADALSFLRQGYDEKMQTVYLVPNHEEGLMEYYTEDGIMVTSRKLRPDERQLNTLQHMAGGAGKH